MQNDTSLKFQDKLQDLLQNTKYSIEGEFNKSALLTDALTDNEKLISLLLKDSKVKEHFFKQVADITIFQKEKFIDFIQLKEFLPNSYTAFSNKIGLNLNSRPISKIKDVVLDFPYKDCVLEGGQDKEDQKRDEIFYNETLSPDEIDRLLEPKAFINFKKYDEKGKHELEPNHDFTKDNLIIKGNNLLALHSILGRYRGKVKLIYIDPPYNTGNGSFHYNDSFNHSAWLTFMKNRLTVARELLREDGVIWINIDDKESHYLKVLSDDIFDRENFVGNVVWQKKYTISNDAKYLSDNHDHILIYSKNIDVFKMNKFNRPDSMDKRYMNPDNHPKGLWKPTPLHAKSGSSTSEPFEYIFNNGVVWKPPLGTYPRFSRDSLDKMDANNEIWFGKDGNSIPSRKTFLCELKHSGVTPLTIWLFKDAGHNHEAKEEVKQFVSDNTFSTPKPEKLIGRIIQLGTDQNDIILDYHLGSGTTAAVAHKMGRQYIGIEQMNYIEDITVERLKKVIGSPKRSNGKMFDELDYDKGGISESVDWKGGGSFTYLELAEFNQAVIDKIQSAQNKKDLLPLVGDVKQEKQCYQCLEVEMKEFDYQEFSKLSLDDQKKILIRCLEKNHLYVNLSDMKDIKYNLSKEDIELNRAFYREEAEL